MTSSAIAALSRADEEGGVPKARVKAAAMEGSVVSRLRNGAAPPGCPEDRATCVITVATPVPKVGRGGLDGGGPPAYGRARACCGLFGPQTEQNGATAGPSPHASTPRPAPDGMGNLGRWRPLSRDRSGPFRAMSRVEGGPRRANRLVIGVILSG